MSGAEGRFRTEGLPPGEYLAIAVDATTTVRDGDQWQDPDYLETLATAAHRIRLSEGGSLSLMLDKNQ
jgi:hypothetical protein